ncbi:MAG: PIN domain-containing protein [Bryobacteraceae bacterium]
MNYLLHSDTLQALVNGTPSPTLRTLIEQTPPTQLHISVLVFAEVLAAVELRKPATPALTAWLRRIPTEYPDRLIPVTIEIAAAWPNLAALAQEKGHTLSLVDGISAATALHYDMVLVTQPSPALQATGARLR